jgi:hypothetical protein
MKLSEPVEPVGYHKADAPEAIPNQEILALLKVLALTGEVVADGKVEPAADAFAGIHARLKG